MHRLLPTEMAQRHLPCILEAQEIPIDGKGPGVRYKWAEALGAKG